MHCNQALCSSNPVYGSYGFPYPCNYTLPPQCGGMYSDVIGEGDITSVMLPDGTVQFLFNPSHQFNPNTANTNCRPYMNPHAGSWLIRSIANPIPTSTYNPGCPRYEFQGPFNTHNNGFHMKFHNDNCTSTSDIHYFYPSLRRYECYAKAPSIACAAVQVEGPVTDNTIHHYICAKPCNCAPMHCCETEGSQGSNMSIENTSKDSSRCSSCKESKGKKHATRERKKRRSKNKSRKVICECDKSPNIPAIDKSMTTYADNGSNCAPTGGRETQTCCDPVPVVSVKKVLKGCNVQTELYPKSPKCKKRTENAYKANIIGISSSCSSNCSCRSYTE